MRSTAIAVKALRSRCHPPSWTLAPIRTITPWLMALALASLTTPTASAGTLLGARGFTQLDPNTIVELVAIDTDSFAVTVIGTIGVPMFGGGFEVDASCGCGYLVTGGVPSGQGLYDISLSNGAANFVGANTESLSGLGLDSSSGILYATTRSGIPNLHTVDTSTGALTQIGADFALGSFINGLAYDSTRDLLYGIDANYALYTIDRATGTITTQLNPGFAASQVDSLAYDPEKDLLWAVNFFGTLYSYDPNNGYAVTERATGLGRIDGLGYAVPEPARLWLFGSALVALVWRSRGGSSRRESEQHL